MQKNKHTHIQSPSHKRKNRQINQQKGNKKQPNTKTIKQKPYTQTDRHNNKETEK